MVVTQNTMAATLKASNDGLELVDAARRKKRWNKSEKAWAGLATTSQSTLRRFWAGLPIRSETFQSICKAVGIEDWDAIVQEADEKKDEEKKVKSCEKLLSLKLKISLDELTKAEFDAIISRLIAMSDSCSFDLTDAKEGSLNLIFKGSDEGLQRIQQLFERGALTEIEGVEVLEVKYLAKNELADIIQTNGAEAFDLEGVNLGLCRHTPNYSHRIAERQYSKNFWDLIFSQL